MGDPIVYKIASIVYDRDMMKQNAPDIQYNQNERRAKPRLACIFPVVVRTHQTSLVRTETQAILTNISASGMLLRTNKHIPRGAKIFLVAKFTNSLRNKIQFPTIAATAEIVRVEARPEGGYSVAIRLLRHRFL